MKIDSNVKNYSIEVIMKKYRAFISYSRRDSKFANWLHKEIEQYTIPNKLKIKYPHLSHKVGKIFKDTEDLTAHSSLSDALKETLENSEYLIVLCSTSSAQAHWVNEEIKYFKSLEQGKNIIPIIIEGEPNATTNSKLDNKFEAYPEALRFTINEKKQTKNPENPLGIDIRDGKDSKAKGFIRIIAKLLNVDFDEIWNREKKRQQQKLFLKIITITIILSIAAFGIYEWIKEAQTRAINSELSKLVNDKNNTSAELDYLQKKTTEAIFNKNKIKKLEDRLNNTTSSIKFTIKNDVKSLQLVQNISGSSSIAIPLPDMSRTMNTCTMITQTISLDLKEKDILDYCQCLYKTTVKELKGEKAFFEKCEKPIRTILGLPKNSNYRKQSLEKTKKFYKNMDKIMQSNNDRAMKLAKSAQKNASDTLNQVMQQVPGWDSKTQTVNPRNAFVYSCILMNQTQNQSINKDKIKSYCQCMYDNTIKNVGTINYNINIHNLFQSVKQQEEYQRKFQKELQRQQPFCMKKLGI